jgi:hypothetical protein
MLYFTQEHREKLAFGRGSPELQRLLLADLLSDVANIAVEEFYRHVAILLDHGLHWYFTYASLYSISL